MSDACHENEEVLVSDTVVVGDLEIEGFTLPVSSDGDGLTVIDDDTSLVADMDFVADGVGGGVMVLVGVRLTDCIFDKV